MAEAEAVERRERSAGDERSGVVRRDDALAGDDPRRRVATRRAGDPVVEVASREDSSEADRLIALMQRCRPTVLQATPVTWRMLLDGGWKGDRALKALIGGEARPVLPVTIGDEFHEKAKPS